MKRADMTLRSTGINRATMSDGVVSQRAGAAGLAEYLLQAVVSRS